MRYSRLFYGGAVILCGLVQLMSIEPSALASCSDSAFSQIQLQTFSNPLFGELPPRTIRKFQFKHDRSFFDRIRGLPELAIAEIELYERSLVKFDENQSDIRVRMGSGQLVDYNGPLAPIAASRAPDGQHSGFVQLGSGESLLNPKDGYVDRFTTTLYGEDVLPGARYLTVTVEVPGVLPGQVSRTSSRVNIEIRTANNVWVYRDVMVSKLSIVVSDDSGV